MKKKPELTKKKKKISVKDLKKLKGGEPCGKVGVESPTNGKGSTEHTALSASSS